jgi:hypothetical protein
MKVASQQVELPCLVSGCKAALLLLEQHRCRRCGVLSLTLLLVQEHEEFAVPNVAQVSSH